MVTYIVMFVGTMLYAPYTQRIECSSRQFWAASALYLGAVLLTAYIELNYGS